MPLLTEGLCLQLTSSVITQCKSLGIRTITDFILTDPEDLAKKIEISYKDITCIRRMLLANFSGLPQRADSLYAVLLESISILSTGSERVNKFLNGGIYTGEVTEIHGQPGSGKSQICLSILSNVVLEARSTVLYIDTNNSFIAARVEQMLMKKCKITQVITEKLQNIKIINVYDIYDLFTVLDYVKAELYKKETAFFRHLKLLIIDSITHLLAPCFGGKYLNGLGLMSNVAQQFKILCGEHMISIMVCNNTVQDKGFEVKPALGPNWKYVPSVSLCVKKETGTKHKLAVMKSCRSAVPREIAFKITDAGISD